MTAELDRIKSQYSKRNKDNMALSYQSFLPYIYMSRQEKERKLYSLLRKNNINIPLATLLEIGCGRGGKILDLLQMGFSPGNLMGNELMEDNLEYAKKRLPQSVQLFSGDARALQLKESSLDIVYQSMVFSSILDDEFQEELANLMWKWVKPGGSVLWYDFAFNNPNNPNVRGVSMSRVKELFPEGKLLSKRVTLAPPLSRMVTKIHPSLYTLLNAIPLLRTHRLCFITKPTEP